VVMGRDWSIGKLPPLVGAPGSRAARVGAQMACPQTVGDVDYRVIREDQTGKGAVASSKHATAEPVIK
jgi:hypothetical protein